MFADALPYREQIIAEVTAAVRGWRMTARRIGIAKREQEMFAARFISKP